MIQKTSITTAAGEDGRPNIPVKSRTDDFSVLMKSVGKLSEKGAKNNAGSFSGKTSHKRDPSISSGVNDPTAVYGPVPVFYAVADYSDAAAYSGAAISAGKDSSGNAAPDKVTAASLNTGNASAVEWNSSQTVTADLVSGKNVNRNSASVYPAAGNRNTGQTATADLIFGDETDSDNATAAEWNSGTAGIIQNFAFGNLEASRNAGSTIPIDAAFSKDSVNDFTSKHTAGKEPADRMPVENSSPSRTVAALPLDSSTDAAVRQTAKSGESGSDPVNPYTNAADSKLSGKDIPEHFLLTPVSADRNSNSAEKMPAANVVFPNIVNISGGFQDPATSNSANLSQQTFTGKIGYADSNLLTAKAENPQQPINVSPQNSSLQPETSRGAVVSQSIFPLQTATAQSNTAKDSPVSPPGFQQTAAPLQTVFSAQPTDMRRPQTVQNAVPLQAVPAPEETNGNNELQTAVPLNTTAVQTNTAKDSPVSQSGFQQAAAVTEETNGKDEPQAAKLKNPKPGIPAGAQTDSKTGSASDTGRLSKASAEISAFQYAGTSPIPAKNSAEVSFQNYPSDSQTSSVYSDSRTDSGFQTADKTQSAAVSETVTEQKDEKPEKADILPASYSLSSRRTVVQISDASSQVGKPVLHQVTDQILVNYNQNRTEFQMELYPEKLGKVSVKLTMENNVLTVAVSAEDSKTQSLLLSHAGHIQSILQDSTKQNVQVVDPQPKQWYQQNQDNPHQSQQDQRQQQQQSRTFSSDSSDSENGEDFLTLMQRLRLQTITA